MQDPKQREDQNDFKAMLLIMRRQHRRWCRWLMKRPDKGGLSGAWRESSPSVALWLAQRGESASPVSHELWWTSAPASTNRHLNSFECTNPVTPISRLSSLWLAKPERALSYFHWGVWKQRPKQTLQKIFNVTNIKRNKKKQWRRNTARKDPKPPSAAHGLCLVQRQEGRHPACAQRSTLSYDAFQSSIPCTVRRMKTYLQTATNLFILYFYILHTQRCCFSDH